MKQFLTLLASVLFTATTLAQGNLTVVSGANLTLSEDASITASGNLTNTGTVTLNSTADNFSSIIVSGSSSGDIVYNRYVNTVGTGEWDLIGSPVDGLSINDFVTTNSSVLATNGSAYAVGYHDNTDDSWTNYTTSTVGGAGNFDTARGYQMATSSGATMAFTGSIATTDQTQSIINNNGNGNGGRRWNLVANPFPSYLNANTNAHASNNFLSVNASVIDSSFLSIYGWAADGSGYTIYNNTSSATYIAPGQGFFIAADSNSNTVLNFTAAMRTTTGTGDFVLGPQPLIYRLELILKDETQKVKTNFYFKNGLSLDLDPGYDAGAYNQSTKLSTRLPQGSNQTAFAINAMDINSLENTRVPLEIRQNAGQAFRVSIAEADLPEDIYVYLEDTLNGTVTSLKENDFELTAQSDLSGAERFFIVFKDNSVLSSGDTLGIDALNVFKANNNNFVTIAGITPELGKLDVTLYNILGMRVREKALNPATATQRVSTEGLASGLYVVQVRSANQIFNKKIIVE